MQYLTISLIILPFNLMPYVFGVDISTRVRFNSCKFTDEHCKIGLLNTILHKLYEGEFRFNPKIDFKVRESPLHLDFTLRQNYLLGLYWAEIQRVQGFSEYINQVHTVTVKVPRLILYGFHSIEGRIANMPIDAYGQYNMSLNDVNYNLNFIGSADRNYMNVLNVTVNLFYKDAKFYVRDLGPQLPEQAQALQIMRDNWSKIKREAFLRFNHLFTNLYENLLKITFHNKAYSEYFSH